MLQVWSHNFLRNLCPLLSLMMMVMVMMMVVMMMMMMMMMINLSAQIFDQQKCAKAHV